MWAHRTSVTPSTASIPNHTDKMLCTLTSRKFRDCGNHSGYPARGCYTMECRRVLARHAPHITNWLEKDRVPHAAGVEHAAYLMPWKQLQTYHPTTWTLRSERFYVNFDTRRIYVGGRIEYHYKSANNWSSRRPAATPIRVFGSRPSTPLSNRTSANGCPLLGRIQLEAGPALEPPLVRALRATAHLACPRATCGTTCSVKGFQRVPAASCNRTIQYSDANSRIEP